MTDLLENEEYYVDLDLLDNHLEDIRFMQQREVEKSDTNGSDMYSVAPLAALLGVTEMDLSKVVEGTMVISPNMLLEMRKQAFFGVLETELLKVNAHYQEMLMGVQMEYDVLEKTVKETLKWQGLPLTIILWTKSRAKALLKHVEEVQKYTGVNQLAFLRILRKFDKLTSLELGDAYMQNKVARMPFYSSQHASMLVSRIHMIKSYYEDLELLPIGLDVSADLGVSAMQRTLFQTGAYGALVVYMMTMLLIYCFIVNDLDFQFPPALFALTIICFSATLSGIVMYVCCRRKINYMKLLGTQGRIS